MLWLCSDGCKCNWGQAALWALVSTFIASGRVKELVLYRGIPGHTHNEVDEVFHCIGQVFKGNDVPTMSRFLELVKPVKSKCTPYCSEGQSFGLPDFNYNLQMRQTFQPSKYHKLSLKRVGQTKARVCYCTNKYMCMLNF